MKIYFLCLLLIILFLNACVLISPPFPKYGTHRWYRCYTGGDGSSTQQAVIISPKEARKHQGLALVYIHQLLQNEGKKFKISSKPTEYAIDTKTYLLVKVNVIDGTQREYHFDTTLSPKRTSSAEGK